MVNQNKTTTSQDIGEVSIEKHLNIRRENMKRIILLMLGALFVIFLAACNGESEESKVENDVSESDTIKIGSLHPLTGATASEGQEMKNAIQLAVDQKNAEGGIKSLDGMKVELIAGDHEDNQEKGNSEVQRMSNEGVVGIIGPYSSVEFTATQEAEKEGIPFIIDVGSHDDLTARGLKYTFRVQPMASFMANDFLKHFKNINEDFEGEIKTAVISHEDSHFGTFFGEFIEEHADKIGLDILDRLPHSAATADLSSDVNKIKSLEPDVLIATTFLPDGKLLIDTLKGSGFTAKVIIGVANGAFSNTSFITEDTDTNQYILDTNYALNPNNELTEQVKEEYREKYGKELGPNSALSYESARVLLEAIEKAGSTDTEKIREALQDTNIEDTILAQGPIIFDESGQNKNAQAVLNQIVDGKSVIVLPEDIQVETPIYPLP